MIINVVRESHRSDIISVLLIPSAMCLFNSIKRLFEQTHMVWELRMTNVWRLENVRCFIEIVVQEDIFDFQFMKAPWFWEDNTEHSSNDSRFDYGAEFSPQSTPVCWFIPLHTRRALYHSDPSEFFLCMKIHKLQITLALVGGKLSTTYYLH